MSNTYDKIIEEIFLENVYGILKLTDFRDADIIEFVKLDKQVELNFEKELDFAVKVKYKNEIIIVHFEAQTYYNKDIPKRMFYYNMALRFQNDLKVASVLLLFSHKGYKLENILNSYKEVFSENQLIEFRYNIIYGWKDIAKTIIDYKLEGLYPLLFLSEEEEREKYFEYADKELEKINDNEKRAKLNFASTVFSSLNRFIEKVIKKINILRGSTMLTFPYIEKIKEEGIKLGEERGIRLGEERGIKLGEERGKIIDKQETIQTILKKRFGTVDNVIVTKLNSIENIELLEEILDKSLDAKSINELLSYFE